MQTMTEYFAEPYFNQDLSRDSGATLRLGGGEGGLISDLI